MKSSPETVKIQGGLAAALAGIAGYMDAYLYLNYKLYASFMSGNTTQTGLHAGRADFAEAACHLLPIISFFGGVFAGTLIERSGLRFPIRISFAAVSVLILAAMIFQSLLPQNDANIILLSSAMGILNTTLVRVGTQAVSLGYVTGVINNAAKHLALAARRVPVEQPQGSWDTHLRRVLLLLSVWASFLLGALASGTATGRFAVWTLLPPALVLMTLAAFNRNRNAEPRNVAK